MKQNATIFNPGDLLKHRYRVVKLLGEGGFGQTFEVRDLHNKGSRNVLKVLLDYFPKAQELFQREAEVLQHLDYPGIPKVERSGYFTIEPEGESKPLHCLVMEYVRGENLEQWLEQNQPIDQDLALDWLKQLIEILGLVHDLNYFHRDIKPSNIMLQPDGQLALIDFGAVREISETYLDKMSAKHRGTAIGSAGYKAPEQADGQGVPESDFFSLGRTFVHLLTGQHPWQFKQDRNNGRLIWRDNAPQVSPEFADLIDDMMAPFPGQRPDRAQIIYRLERIAAGLPIISPLVDRARFQRQMQINVLDSPQTPPSEKRALQRQRSDRPLKQNIGLKMAAFVSFLCLAVIGGLHLGSVQIEVALNKQGVKHHRAKELVRAEAFYRFALLLKSDYGKVNYNLGTMYEDRNELDRAIREYQKAAQGGVAPAYNNLAHLHIGNGEYDQALPLLLKGFELADSNTKKYTLLVNLGRVMFRLNRYSDARDYLQKAIALNRERSAAHCLMPPVLDALGNRQGALLELERCPIDSPNTPSELHDWLRQRTREGLLVVRDI